MTLQLNDTSEVLTALITLMLEAVITSEILSELQVVIIDLLISTIVSPSHLERKLINDEVLQ